MLSPTLAGKQDCVSEQASEAFPPHMLSRPYLLFLPAMWLLLSINIHAVGEADEQAISGCLIKSFAYQLD